MPSRKPLLIAAALVAVLGGGALVAQMESGERGIMPLDSSGTLEVGGISVDIGGKDANSARYAGWRIAQREGFRKLWAKMQGRPESEAPTLPDSTLDQLVSSIIVEKEQIGPNRYIATLGVQFDRAKAGELLGLGGQMQRSAPMLLIPVITTAGTQTSLELRNPWQRAWAQFRTSESPIDYVRLSGLGLDPLLVNAAQVRRPGRGWWRNIIDLYDAADILVAEVQLHRAYPGGPAVARFIARHGPDGQILGGFSLTAKDSAAIPAMMADGVRRTDELFSQALAAGMLSRDPSLIAEAPPPIEDEVIEAPGQAAVPAVNIGVQIDSPDAPTLIAAENILRSIAGVESVSETSIAIGGSSTVIVSFRGDSNGLASALIARGWSVTNIGGTLRVSRAPGAPPVSQPEGDQ